MPIMKSLRGIFTKSPEPVITPSKSKTNFVPSKDNGWNIQFNYPASSGTHVNATWVGGSQSPNQIIYNQLGTLRNRSREQYQSNDYVRRFIRLCRTNVIGHTGIQFKSYALGIDGEPSQEIIEDVEQEVYEWFQGPIDYHREMTWIDILNLSVSSLVMDGECFLRLHTQNNLNGFGIAVEVIDAALIDHRYNNDLQNGNVIRSGIEYNPRGIAVAYHIGGTYQHQGGFAERTNRRMRTRVSADNMIHLFDREYPGQIRGIPRTATGIARTNQMRSYEEAAIVNARYGASKMVFFKSPDGAGIPGEGYWPNGYKVTNVVPGAVEMLPEGVEPVPFDPTYPTNEYDPFISRNLRGAASGFGVAYESLSNDRAGVNFSSLRSGVQEDRDTWRELQKLVETGLCEKLINRFFEVRSGYLGSVFAPPYEYDDQFRDITKHRWRPRNWAWVDPLKDVQASKLEIEMGVKSPFQHMQDAGRDPFETMQEIARWQEMIAEFGIALGEHQQDISEEVDEDA